MASLEPKHCPTCQIKVSPGSIPLYTEASVWAKELASRESHILSLFPVTLITGAMLKLCLLIGRPPESA